MDKARHDRDLLAQLAAHPGWPVWREYVEQEKQRYYQTLARRLATTTKPVDQRRLDEERGGWKKVDELLAHPTRVLEKLRLEGDDA